MPLKEKVKRRLTLDLLLATIIIALISVYVWMAFCCSEEIQSLNYFEPQKGRSRALALTGRFIVDQKHCKIPEVELWSMEGRMSFRVYKRPDCLNGTIEGSIPGLTFVNKTHLVINTTLAKSSKLKLESLECCYQEIQQPPPEVAKSKLDDFYNKKLSDRCIPIKGTHIVPEVNSLEATCVVSSGNGQLTQIHRDFHVLANVLPGDAKLAGKIQFWKDKLERPPNVYVLGLDCGNRLNVRRQMPSTVEFLEKMGATEMLGYTKVGFDTGTNLLPMLTSFTAEELEKKCKYVSERFVDKCPWIFYDYSKANYVTSFFEDASSLKSELDAFIESPTDFYHVVWSRYIHKQIYTWNQYDLCMENKTIYEVMIDFSENLATIMGDLRLPYFSFTWIGLLAHDDFNGLQHIDKHLRDSLQRLHNAGYMDNTLFILVGDHGYRWYDIRQSASGWYEFKQPALWLNLPPTLTHKRPELKKAVRHNADKLSSPFDVYQTLKQVLSLSSSGTPVKDLGLGLSFLTKLKDRNCSAAGIPPEFCACTVLLPFQDVHRPFLQRAAQAALQAPNFSKETLPKGEECEKLKVMKILGGAVMSDSYQDYVSDDQLEELVTSGENNLIVSALTSVFNEFITLEFILKYDFISKPPFQVVYAFGVDATNVHKVTRMGYYRCVDLSSPPLNQE